MSGDIQSKIKRSKPSRVNIAYKVDVGGAQTVVELPVNILVISDLCKGKYLQKLADRETISVDKENFTDIMEKLSPTIDISVKNFLNPESNESIRLNYTFRKMEDFLPSNLLLQNAATRSLYQSIMLMQELLAKTDGQSKLSEALEKLVKHMKLMASKKSDDNQAEKDNKSLDASESNDK